MLQSHLIFFLLDVNFDKSIVRLYFQFIVYILATKLSKINNYVIYQNFQFIVFEL